MITCLNGTDHVNDHALITWLSCTDDVPQEAIFKCTGRNHTAQLAIIKQMRRQETRSSAGNCQAALRQESRSSAGPDHVTEHALFTWLIIH